MLRKTQIRFFSLLPPWAAQAVQTEEFMFQNVAYSPTVHRTGCGICRKNNVREWWGKNNTKYHISHFLLTMGQESEYLLKLSYLHVENSLIRSDGYFLEYEFDWSHPSRCM